MELSNKYIKKGWPIYWSAAVKNLFSLGYFLPTTFNAHKHSTEKPSVLSGRHSIRPQALKSSLMRICHFAKGIRYKLPIASLSAINTGIFYRCTSSIASFIYLVIKSIKTT